ncbi:hypothetical protein V8D89_009176 [Ganoderma adspersum]
MAASALAPAPSAFADCGRISATNAAAHAITGGVQLEYTSSPYGIRTQFQIIPLSQYFSLNPMAKPGRGQLEEDMKPWEWYLAILGCEHAEHPKHLLGHRVKRIELKTVYISHPASGDTGSKAAQPFDEPLCAINLVLPTKARDALRAQGGLHGGIPPSRSGP